MYLLRKSIDIRLINCIRVKVLYLKYVCNHVATAHARFRLSPTFSRQFANVCDGGKYVAEAPKCSKVQNTEKKHFLCMNVN